MTTWSLAKRSTGPGGVSTVAVPRLIDDAGPAARYAFEEFFASIENPHTRRAYERAVRRFIERCDSSGIGLHHIRPSLVAQFVHGLAHTRDGGPELPSSKPTKKLYLAALRRFFDYCVERHAILLNPAAAVRGPRHSTHEGKTPAFDTKLTSTLLGSIDTGTPIGIRDRAVLATFIFTAARVGAIAKLRRTDFFSDGRQHYFRFDEKGGKQRVIPARFDLQGYVEDYLLIAPETGPHGPLFCSSPGRSGGLTARPICADDLLRMVKRRLRACGLPGEALSCHSFRAGTATNLLEQGVDPAEVQYLLGHSDPRTTRLYDRRQLGVSRNIVERIAV